MMKLVVIKMKMMTDVIAIHLPVILYNVLIVSLIDYSWILNFHWLIYLFNIAMLLFVFFAGEDAFLDLQTYLRSVILTPYSYNMLFARLLYPSYYFDNYERVINFKENEEAMIKIISKVDDYEKFLKNNLFNINHTPWSKVFKKSFLVNNNLFFKIKFK